MYKEVEAKPDQIDDKEFNIREADTPPTLESILNDGYKGEVCCIEPLHTKTELCDHPITNYSSLAMSSLTEILVIGLKLSLKVWMTFAYGRIDPSNVPLLTLCYPARSPKPHAGICRGDVVHFLLVKRDLEQFISLNRNSFLCTMTLLTLLQVKSDCLGLHLSLLLYG
ncbi:vacuolar protein sorting-associated protein 8 homolog isoform X3 [Xenopus laevis]|uniref:Vacuolar protein sorting-associated protein 8 homolog isoform X3 n=1 Tax=Xenopus laevis TaxID=8355 RepID=A0A8J1M0Q5_XENLA|nr:vacuolar protein sorting-associated protein 8 homolog isoform X3 [Xenopus laevis]